MKSDQTLEQVLSECLGQWLPGVKVIGERQRLLLALSGGPDSTALLLALAGLRDRNLLSCELLACHINHGLRGADSDLDEEFCRDICGDHDVALTAQKVQPGDSSESTLRDLRYEALEETAKAHDVAAILTAHTLDDQIETMLFRMFRGTSATGLTGIPVRRLSKGGIAIIRPLLSVRRQLLQKYLDDNQVVARIDATNLTSDYARNYIRNELVPRIDARFQGFVARMEQLRHVLAAEDEYLQEAARDLRKSLGSCYEVELAGDILHRYNGNPAIVRRFLAHELKKRQIEVSYERVEKLLGFLESGAGAISLDERWDAVMDGGRLIFEDKTAVCALKDESHLEHAVRVPGQTMALDLGYALRVERLSEKDLPEGVFPASNAWEALVDLSECSAPFVLRVRRQGDVIIPFGMQQQVRLKQFLRTHERTEAALSLKGNAIVLADRNQVLWVPGVGLSNRVRVKARPTHVLRLMKIAADDLKLS
jgi:tRNA(Ile)-lysidine synthase